VGINEPKLLEMDEDLFIDVSQSNESSIAFSVSPVVARTNSMHFQPDVRGIYD
jgi:hypothetical protein